MLVNIFGDFGCFDYSVVLFFGLSKVVIFHAFEEWLLHTFCFIVKYSTNFVFSFEFVGLKAQNPIFLHQIRLISLSSEGLLSCFLGSVIVFYSKWCGNQLCLFGFVD